MPIIIQKRFNIKNRLLKILKKVISKNNIYPNKSQMTKVILVVWYYAASQTVNHQFK